MRKLKSNPTPELWLLFGNVSGLHLEGQQGPTPLGWEHHQSSVPSEHAASCSFQELRQDKYSRNSLRQCVSLAQPLSLPCVWTWSIFLWNIIQYYFTAFCCFTGAPGSLPTTWHAVVKRTGAGISEKGGNPAPKLSCRGSSMVIGSLSFSRA